MRVQTPNTNSSTMATEPPPPTPNCEDNLTTPQTKVDNNSRRRKSSRSTNTDERTKRIRRSKSDAMLSIKSTKQTNNNNKSRKSEPGPSRNPNRLNLNLNQKNERKLDINSIRLIAPRISPKHDQSKRLFNLEHCPIFYPTIEEFKDPMKYFDSISSKLKSFGIGKIVPPIGWKSPCVLDTESFRFKTRLQRLNSMEASARANINFLDQLYIFHKQQGNSSFVNNSCKIQVPNIDYRPVDLWRVRKAVNALGGYDVITAQRKWSFLAKSLGYAVQRSPAIAFQLKTAYLKIIAPFEEYMNRVKLIQSPQRFKSPLDSLSPLTSPGPLSNNPNVTDESKPEISQNNNDDDNIVSANPSTASLSAPSREWEESNDRGGEICEICGSDEDDPNILLCDCCDKGYHLQCLTPALQAVPEGNWFCDACILSTGNEFGFEEGQEYNLANFQLRADNFKKKWIESHPIPIKKDSNGNNNNLELDETEWSKEEFKKELELENHMEREFWRLVESPNENVEIEYGADIHSSTYGSGFPHVEKHPLEPYARDGWNLNNLPIAPGSLLRYIKSDIAGMTQPWIYVGMAFSTFAWHKEDHYTYSVNYHHWGDTKTWYGVPGEDDEKLEAAMKLAAPELFEQQPDVMYQLVTLMSPGRLKSAGVRTYVCDQRPNEFVITCPRSYHSGFNHGFNLNEAVNFCLPDWLPDGNLCVKHYKSLKKLPVFSHDELLITIFLNEKSPKVSRWLLPHFREMIRRELSDRENARTSISNLSTEVLIEPEDLAEDQIQCHHCKSLGYLSHVTSPGCPRVSCLEHSHTLGDGVKVLRFKYPDDVLEAMLLRVTNRSIKAGRQMDLTGIEQRTSGRKRKPTTTPLEASRPTISSAQKSKLGHLLVDHVREHAGGDADTVMAHESSIDCEVDGKTEEMSMDSEMIHQNIGNDGVFDETKIEKDENQVDNWLKSINRGKRNGTNTIPNCTPSPLPALDIAQAQAQARTQRKAQTVKLSDDLTTTAEFALLQPKIIAETPIASTSIQPTTPAPRNRRPSSHPRSAVVGGKRRGRPPKTAEVRAAEAAVKLENKRIAEANRRAAIKAATAAAKAAQAEADAQAQAQTEAEAQAQTDRMPVVAQVDIEGSASIVTLGESSQAVVDSNPSTPALSLAGTPTLRRGRRSKPDSLGPLPTVQTPLSNLTQNPSSNLFTRPSPNVIKIKPLSRSVSQPVDPSLLSAGTSHVPPLPIQQLPSGYAIPTHSRPPSVNHHNQTYEQRPTSASRLESPHHHSSSHRLPQATISEPRLSTPSSLSNILNPAPSRPVHDSNLHQRPQPRYGSTEASITNYQLPSHHHQHQQQQLTPSAASRTSSRPGSSTGGNQLFNHHSSPRSPHLSPSIINNNISFHHSHSATREHSIISNSFILSPHRPSGSLTSNSIIQDHHSTTSSS